MIQPSMSQFKPFDFPPCPATQYCHATQSHTQTGPHTKSHPHLFFQCPSGLRLWNTIFVFKIWKADVSKGLPRPHFECSKRLGVEILLQHLLCIFRDWSSCWGGCTSASQNSKFDRYWQILYNKSKYHKVGFVRNIWFWAVRGSSSSSRDQMTWKNLEMVQTVWLNYKQSWQGWEFSKGPKKNGVYRQRLEQ